MTCGTPCNRRLLACPGTTEAVNCYYCDLIVAADPRYAPRPAEFQWGQLKPFLSFHRPLRDYVAACRQSGLELRDLEEPEVTAEGERTLHPALVRQYRRVAYSYILKFVKT